MVKHNQMLLFKFLWNLGNFPQIIDKETYPWALNLKLIAKGWCAFPIFTVIYNYGQSVCFWRAAQKKNCNSLKNPDNYKKWHPDQLIVVVKDSAGHCSRLTTWKPVSQTSSWQLWCFLLRTTNFSLMRLCRKLLQLSTLVPTSVFAILTVKKPSISCIEFLNLCWKAGIIIKPLKALFPYMSD